MISITLPYKSESSQTETFVCLSVRHKLPVQSLLASRERCKGVKCRCCRKWFPHYPRNLWLKHNAHPQLQHLSALSHGGNFSERKLQSNLNRAYLLQEYSYLTTYFVTNRNFDVTTRLPQAYCCYLFTWLAEKIELPCSLQPALLTGTP